jgi:hypothetical protein
MKAHHFSWKYTNKAREPKKIIKEAHNKSQSFILAFRRVSKLCVYVCMCVLLLLLFPWTTNKTFTKASNRNGRDICYYNKSAERSTITEPSEREFGYEMKMIDNEFVMLPQLWSIERLTGILCSAGDINLFCRKTTIYTEGTNKPNDWLRQRPKWKILKQTPQKVEINHSTMSSIIRLTWQQIVRKMLMVVALACSPSCCVIVSLVGHVCVRLARVALTKGNNLRGPTIGCNFRFGLQTQKWWVCRLLVD